MERPRRARYTDRVPADILVVDDVTENLVAIEATLERLGQNLVLARSGAEALRLCQEREFAVVLLDIQLPDMDGFAVAQRLKALKRPPPVIFLTALYRDELHVTHGYDAGAVDYLFKPIIPSVLRTKVSVFVELFRRGGVPT